MVNILMVPNTKNVLFSVTDSNKYFNGTKYEECFIFGNRIWMNILMVPNTKNVLFLVTEFG